jgi:uncharacterized protein (UPF0303 family)
MLFAAGEDVHEESARKHRVRRKREVDSAFKDRRSSRLALKVPPQFETMMSRAKAVKASRFDFAGGSPRLRVAAGLGSSSVPAPIHLSRLRALAEACGVDPSLVVDAAAVPSSSSC